MTTQKEFDFLIQWHLTERCNLACKHCYQEGGRAEELARSEIDDVLEEIDGMFEAWSETYGVPLAPSFNITGGEPLLRPELIDILAEIRKRTYETFLLTNGTLIDRDRARDLADLGIAGVQVSIEGCEEVHDSLRGPGAFARAASGIERLLDAGLPVTLNVTLSKLNAKSMKKVILFASHLGVQRVGFSRLVPAGRGRSLVSEMLSAEETKELYQKLFALDIGNLDIVTGDPVAALLRSPQEGRKRGKESADPCGGCAAGVSGITIEADGTIVPCRRMPLPLGNVRTDSLREIWALSPVLEALRDKSKYTGRCGTCARWDGCRGCRAIAYAHSRAAGGNDYLADDPQCFYAA